MSAPFFDVLSKISREATSERDKGDRFERLMVNYLKTDPFYADDISQIWMWNDFPYRSQLGGVDTGIDLVVLTKTDEYWSIQCKFYQPDAQIRKSQLDSFIATSNRNFTDSQQQLRQFSRCLVISTTDKWSSNADELLHNQNISVSRILLDKLASSPVDWIKIEQGTFGKPARLAQKVARAHQETAISKAMEHFATADRGKLIMACGTGKTFTALRMAERMTHSRGIVLFLVPSIALLSQSLREWTAEAEKPIRAIAICSDPKVSKQNKKQDEDDVDMTTTVDLALPATTDAKDIALQLRHYFLTRKPDTGMMVVFSTYQSIEAVQRAQALMLKETEEAVFDLVICDEAHRTTGVALNQEDASNFVRIHEPDYIRAKKRVYMTATPRLYSAESKSKAAQSDALLCSMDDEKLYGKEFYRLGFGEAVDKDLLSDYRVMVLTLRDTQVSLALQQALVQGRTIETDDITRLIGCVNAVSKNLIGIDGELNKTDPSPIRKAVAFCKSIAVSKEITRVFNDLKEGYLEKMPEEFQENHRMYIKAHHVDGAMSAPLRDEQMNWLKEEPEDPNECRVLTNVRCLSEGVDVPSLDAVMFLTARNSEIDVVQSVGRVMRKAKDKKYGYIIIPIVIPSDQDVGQALSDSKYKVVWQVLNALRSHDDRFQATINKVDLNKKKPPQILVATVDTGMGDSDFMGEANNAADALNNQAAIQFEGLQNIIYAKLVEKVGDKRYWEQWAKSVAEIADRQTERITRLVRESGQHQEAFESFLDGLRKNINPSISPDDAIEMLSQHTITRPVFDALFEGYSFVKSNPVSQAMQQMLSLIEANTNQADLDELERFYDSVRRRAAGIDNAEGRQRVIVELYDKFFRAAFPKMVERLGIVYTPVEVVDFIIQSVDDLLFSEFGRRLADENVHILDPFTGTGTFITRLIQSGLIPPKDLPRKYAHELHANEIVLLAYYIAAVNIESAFQDVMKGQSNYMPFDGIVLTDTFQLGEKGTEKVFTEILKQNAERVTRQKKAPIQVIIGNPPYSVGQKSANDNAQNQKYPQLDARIANTYAMATKSTNKNSLYDSYIKAFRWSTDRLFTLPEQSGIIAFVSNGAWLDSNSADGFRKMIEREFTSIWVFNLRGNARTQGELRRKEAGNVFDSGSRTPITLTFLIRNPKIKHRPATIYYRDIGDYLSREEKLRIISRDKSVLRSTGFNMLIPNKNADWITQRSAGFEEFVPLGDKESKENKATFFVPFYGRGLSSARDAYCYNSSKESVTNTIKEFISYYEQQRVLFHDLKSKNNTLSVDNFIDFNTNKVTWNRGLKNDFSRNKEITFKSENIRVGMYRPFYYQHVYFAQELNDMLYQLPKLFPTPAHQNVVICVSGVGTSKDFSVIISDVIPDIQLQFNGQAFPLYYYEERSASAPTLFDIPGEVQYDRRDGITDYIWEQAKKRYGKNVSKEDIFYYVYGMLHSPEYRTRFANDLKKMLPRLPLIEDLRAFWQFSKAGRELAALHIGYEQVPPHPEVEVEYPSNPDRMDAYEFYAVEKMRFPSKGQKDTILFNPRLKVHNIPAEAYEYIVNGKSAIEWIMERYQITVHKESGIRNDPNDWAREQSKPSYILDLLLSIIHVSTQTVAIVKGLPTVDWEKV